MKRIIVFICGLVYAASPAIAADFAGTSTGTELNYVHGVTSGIQAQINGKISTGGNAGTATALAADPAGCTGGQVTTDINASGTASCTSWAANILTLMGYADFAAVRTGLGLVIGTNVQAYNSNLTAINQALTNTSNPAFSTLNLVGAGLTVGTGSTTAGLLQIKNATNNNIFTVQPGATGAALSWTLPIAAPGGANYLLNVDADGTMGYTDPATFGGGSMTWPSTAGIAYWTSGTAWGGAYNASTKIPSNYIADATNAAAGVATAAQITELERLGAAAPAGSDGAYYLRIVNNTARAPTASVNELYPEANVWKVNQNGTESSVAIGPTGTQISFSGTLTNGRICTFATGGAISCDTTASGTGDFLANGTVGMTGAIVPSVAGGQTIGTGALPFSSIYIGGAATNNFQITGTSAAARVVNIPDIAATGYIPLLSATSTTAGQIPLATTTAGKNTYSTAVIGTTTNVASLTNGTGSITAAAGVAAAFNTALTVQTGAVTLTGNAGGSTLVLPSGSTTLGTGASATIANYVAKTSPVTQCAVIPAAVTTDDYPIFKAPYALTIVASSIHVYEIGGTNVVGGLDECTGTNGTCGSVVAVDADITGTAGNDVADDGTLTNAGIASGNWIQWHTTSVSGTNTSLSVCFSYTID